jgi:predicted enzyme related to lactoylglutathione lyase
MMDRYEGDPVRGWLYYFNVDDIHAAISRVGEAGGTIVRGAQQVPGGSYIAQALDPQGVLFAMVAPPPH